MRVEVSPTPEGFPKISWDETYLRSIQAPIALAVILTLVSLAVGLVSYMFSDDAIILQGAVAIVLLVPVATLAFMGVMMFRHRRTPGTVSRGFLPKTAACDASITLAPDGTAIFRREWFADPSKRGVPLVVEFLADDIGEFIVGTDREWFGRPQDQWMDCSIVLLQASDGTLLTVADHFGGKAEVTPLFAALTKNIVGARPSAGWSRRAVASNGQVPVTPALRREEPRKKRPAPRLWWSIASLLLRGKFLWLVWCVAGCVFVFATMFSRGPEVNEEAKERAAQAKAMRERLAREGKEIIDRETRKKEALTDQLRRLGEPAKKGDAQQSAEQLRDRAERARQTQKKEFAARFQERLDGIRHSTAIREDASALASEYGAAKKRIEPDAPENYVRMYEERGDRTKQQAYDEAKKRWEDELDTNGGRLVARGNTVSEDEPFRALIVEAAGKMNVGELGMKNAIISYIEKYQRNARSRPAEPVK